MPERTCTKCRAVKPTSDFGPDRRRPEGLKSWCRACLAAAGQQRYIDHKAKVTASNKRWADNNPAAVRAIKRRWDARHPDRGRIEYARNTEGSKARRKRWAAANPGAVAEKERRRRAVQLAATVVPIPARLIALKVAYWGAKCWMCGGPFEHIDHVKPLHAGGLHALANLRPACGACNRRKGAQWPYPYSSRGQETARAA